MTQQEEYKLAKKYGFKCTLDPNRGGNWAKFSKGCLHIWQTGDLKWQTAFQVNKNYFIGHGKKDTLEEAFQTEIIVPLTFKEMGQDRYYCNLGSWEFTIDWHHVKKMYYCEGINKGYNRWKDQAYYPSLEKAGNAVVQFCEYNFGDDYKIIFEGDTEIVHMKRPTKKVCECGAKHTNNSNHHSSWCPIKKE